MKERTVNLVSGERPCERMSLKCLCTKHVYAYVCTHIHVYMYRQKSELLLNANLSTIDNGRGEAYSSAISLSPSITLCSFIAFCASASASFLCVSVFATDPRSLRLCAQVCTYTQAQFHIYIQARICKFDYTHICASAHALGTHKFLNPTCAELNV